MEDNKGDLGLDSLQRRSLLRLGGVALGGIAGGGIAGVLPFSAQTALAADVPGLVAETIRVVVTANNAQGKSYILKDEVIKRGPRPLIWHHNPQDVMGLGGANDPKTVLPSSSPAIDPPVGASEWRFATIPPS